MRIKQGQGSSRYLVVFMLLGLILATPVSKAESDTENYTQDDKIEVVYSAERLASYQKRRQDWSVLFGLSLENLVFSEFRSKIDNQNYEALFGSERLPLYQVDLGFKYNTKLGGISLSGVYGAGAISEGYSGEKTDLNLQKAGVSAALYLDSFFSEPYVVPYASIHIFKLFWNEDTETLGSQSGETAFTTSTQVGLLFQLNWVDPESALEGQTSSGLNNAFLDLYASQYHTSDGLDDPDFQTEVNFGIGIRLEY